MHWPSRRPEDVKCLQATLYIKMGLLWRTGLLTRGPKFYKKELKENGVHKITFFFNYYIVETLYIEI